MENDKGNAMKRREFLRGTVVGLAVMPTLRFPSPMNKDKKGMSKVALIKTNERDVGVRETINLLDFRSM